MSPTELCDLLAGGRSARLLLDSEFDRWWAAHDERSHELLNALALRSPTEPDALEALLGIVDRHRLARAAIWKLLSSEDDVRDAEQAVLATLALRIQLFDGRARFTTWLHQVAANEARMSIRSQSRRPRPASGDERVDVTFLARLSTMVADRDVVDRAVSSLSAIHRELLDLRDVQGLDYDEIAQVLDVPLGTVRSRLSRSREALATALRRELGASGIRLD